jgi:hypothetical protein
LAHLSLSLLHLKALPMCGMKESQERLVLVNNNLVNKRCGAVTLTGLC